MLTEVDGAKRSATIPASLESVPSAYEIEPLVTQRVAAKAIVVALASASASR